MNTLRLFITVILLTMLCGCDLFIAADCMIPRAVTPLDDVAIIEFKYADHDPIKKEIRYEKYYDKSWSYRGNYWSVREVGFESDNQRSTITVNDEKIGTIIFPLPLYYDEYRQQFLDNAYYSVTINGERYSHSTLTAENLKKYPQMQSIGCDHKSQSDNIHRHFKRHSNGEFDILNLTYSFTINGIPMKLSGDIIDLSKGNNHTNSPNKSTHSITGSAGSE